MTKEQLDKLPKWAQTEVRDLLRTVDNLRGELATERNRPESPFKHNPNHNKWDQWVNLPEDHNIRIMVGPDKDAYVDVRIRMAGDTCQEPSIYLSANRGLRIQPESHNTLYVIPEGK